MKDKGKYAKSENIAIKKHQCEKDTLIKGETNKKDHTLGDFEA